MVSRIFFLTRNNYFPFSTEEVETWRLGLDWHFLVWGWRRGERRLLQEKDVWEKPSAKGIKEIIPSGDVSEDAVSYRTYRFENLDQTYNSRVARRLSGQMKRLAITFGNFSGSTPVAICESLNPFIYRSRNFYSNLSINPMQLPRAPEGSLILMA